MLAILARSPPTYSNGEEGNQIDKWSSLYVQFIYLYIIYINFSHIGCVVKLTVESKECSHFDDVG